MSRVVARANVRLRPPSLKVETLSVPMRNHRMDGRQAVRWCLRVMAINAGALLLVLLCGSGTNGGDGSLSGEAPPWLSGRCVGGEAGYGDAAAVGTVSLDEGLLGERHRSGNARRGCAGGLWWSRR